jgi:hypothetical protein
MSRRVGPFLPVPWLVPVPADTKALEGSVTLNGGGAWPSANRAIYVPFSVPYTMLLKSMGFVATTASGNYDLGIYDATCTTRLVSSGAQGIGANLNTFTLTTPLLLEAGVRYYVAMSCSSTPALVRWTPQLESLRLSGAMQEASAHPLPATATGIVVASSYMPGIVFDFEQ